MYILIYIIFSFNKKYYIILTEIEKNIISHGNKKSNTN